MSEETVQESPQQEGRKGSSLVRVIILFCIIVVLLNGALIFQRAVESYRKHITEGQKHSEQLTHSLADHIRLTYTAADLTLKRAVERQYFNTLFGSNLYEDMQNNISRWVRETPQIAVMIMSDSKGRVRAFSSGDNNSKPPNDFRSLMKRNALIIEQEFFAVHKRSDGTDKLYVEHYSAEQEGHSGYVLLSRELTGIDGNFGGVVMLAVDNSYMERFIRAVDIGETTSILLMRDDTVALIDMASSEDVEIIASSAEKLAENDSEQKSLVINGGDLLKGGRFDNHLKIVTLEEIPNLSMVLALVTSGNDIMAGWLKERRNDLIFFSIFVLFVFVISIFASTIARQMRQARRSEKTAIMASQAKSEFLANMSHELRTPLNSIIGFSDMLSSGYFGKLTPQQVERTRDINFCGKHLLELINDVLEFSKGEAGKVELHEEQMSIARTINDTVRIFADRARRDGVRITANIPKNTPYINADPRKMRQILINLTSNALKFTDEGGHIELGCAFDEDRNFNIYVADTGIGMDEKDVPRALSAFGQVHADSSKGGTGLGLPLCVMFAELHGGELNIQSIKSVGTKVNVTLPSSRVIASSVDEEAAKSPARNKQAGRKGKPNGRIIAKSVGNVVTRDEDGATIIKAAEYNNITDNPAHDSKADSNPAKGKFEASAASGKPSSQRSKQQKHRKHKPHRQKETVH